MSDSITKTRSGMFVAGGLILLCVSILLFGGNRAFLTSYGRYEVKFKSTQGLSAGSVISLSGMDVGNIEKITFDKDSELVATLKIDKKYADRITEQSVAGIRTQGALGDKYIYITPGPAMDRALKEGDMIKTDTQLDLLDMISGKAKDLTSVADTVRELNLLLHNLNSDGKSAHVVESLINAGQSVAKLMSEPSIRESVMHLSSILGKIDKGQGTLGELVNDTTLHDRLVGLLGDEPRNRYLKPLIREAIKKNEENSKPR